MNLNPWGKESGGELLRLDGVLWLDVMQPGVSIRSYVLQMAARLSSGQRYCSIPLSCLCEICLGWKVQPRKESVKEEPSLEKFFSMQLDPALWVNSLGSLQQELWRVHACPYSNDAPAGKVLAERREGTCSLWRTYSVTLSTKMIKSGKMESRFPIPILWHEETVSKGWLKNMSKK